MAEPSFSSPAAHERHGMTLVSQLAAGVSHEIKNALQIVRGHIAFAHRSSPEASEMREDLQCALEASDRISDLATQLRQLAKLDQEGCNAADLSLALESALLLIKPTVDIDIRIETRFDADLPRVTANESSLIQALINLCLNANEAMPDGGVLQIVASRSSTQSVPCDIGSLNGRSMVMVSVNDTGCGIDTEMRQRLFEPEFTTKTAKGAGLGLSQVANCVGQAGGAIRVDSSVGEGSCFELYFPIAETTPEVDRNTEIPSPEHLLAESLR